jgi:BirA family biotin operon repressor/biotin-[acetyl-CoA-carboxylase] ligase
MRMGVGLVRGSWRISRVGLISSTQDAARALPVPGGCGRVIVADAQTRGRGRHGRVWHSQPGGLYMTLAIPGVEGVELIPVMAGVSAAEAVRDAYGLEARLKWPNDVMVGRRKLGGILAEALWIDGQARKILIGVGINVNNPLPKALTSATSLSLELGGRVPISSLTALLIERLAENLEVLRDDPGELIRRWRWLSTTITGEAHYGDPPQFGHRDPLRWPAPARRS